MEITSGRSSKAGVGCLEASSNEMDANDGFCWKSARFGFSGPPIFDSAERKMQKDGDDPQLEYLKAKS
ncbi:hypothetical protein M378DRAFT_1011750 [Amanita muscaria Koide BX008]|uniref:Uncharacterized protein n=1 Tax=Amanita muscaria (strain Koide BX008) TaxID=946122 RepID=A0A0C2WSM9_AMAMK|nr:hypothetical protein M378DRAFT_1011750 [Amanita muscaria Koide BX008]